MRTICMSLVAGLVLMAPMAAMADNSLAVTAGAAKYGTNYGLELQLGSTGPDAAYLYAGPDLGFSDETTLKGSFFIGADQLTMSNVAPNHHFQVHHLYDYFGPQAGVKLIFFLHRPIGTNHLFMTVWHYDDTISNFAFTGNGFFAIYQDSYFESVKIEYEWTAGNPGNLKMWRTTYIGTSPDPSGRVQMFDVAVPGMGTAAINHVFVGMLNPNTHRPGTYGTVELDEFAFTR